MTLWTHSILIAARKIYAGAGFVRTAVKPHRDFGVDVVGETWDLDFNRDDRSRVGSDLHRCALSFGATQMLVEARHDLNEIAGAIAVIKLVHQNLVPGIAAGAR